jgi:putative two-component system response regulator
MPPVAGPAAERGIPEEIAKRARVLVVDDEPQNVRYLLDVLSWAGYENVEGLTDPNEVIPRFKEWNPDLVILDLLMPEIDGFAVMEGIQREVPSDTYLPILVLTSDISREARRRALGSGARDFLTKPMSPTEVRFRVANLLETRFLFLECDRQRLALGTFEGDAVDPPATVNESEELLERWAASIEYAAGCGPGHAKRVSWMAGKLGDTLGMPETDVELLRNATLLHDLGSMPEADRAGGHNGRGNGTDPGLEHPEEGAKILEGSRLPVIRLAQEIVLHHRERWDGQGFPGGLVGPAIPLSARIVAVAEGFDQLTSSGSDMTPEEALRQLERHSGRRFDPSVVEALIRCSGASLT